MIREDKRGYIPGEMPRLLDRLAIDPEHFIASAGRMLRQFGSAIGTPTHIIDLCVARQASCACAVQEAGSRSAIGLTHSGLEPTPETERA